MKKREKEAKSPRNALAGGLHFAAPAAATAGACTVLKPSFPILRLQIAIRLLLETVS
jgi:hypothetical protein